MLAFHNLARTWEKLVDVYITATEFYRGKYIAGGLPADKIAVKPHFVVPEPTPKESFGDYALYIGRLTAEKGVPTLLRAWRGLDQIPLKVRGEGLLYDEVCRFSDSRPFTVHLLPRISRDELTSVLKGSRFLVWPSEGYYETFGLVAIESFACGVPVITTGLGAMGGIVEDGRTGLHFKPGDPVDLAAKVEWAWSHPEKMREMGVAARAEYEAKYTAERNYKMLMAIYERALCRRKDAAEQSANVVTAQN
jgi:glycosyltransferase involved in cell wall biosynthesis